MTRNGIPHASGAAPASRGLVTRLLDLLGNTWFGVAMLALVLVYCWIGSAGTAPFGSWFVRQTFEKTELEWFNWWPFSLMIALMCLSLIISTLRRIPLTLPNLGVWTTHAGIIVLALGSLIYFGLKKEGDVVVYRRQAVIKAGNGEPVAMTLNHRAMAVAGDGTKSYRVRVTELNPDYELLTGADAGKRTYAAQLLVEPMGHGDVGQPFIRQLLAGYPQYTEDVIPGQGRAIKVAGKSLVDEDLDISLRYEPQDRMFLYGHPALHVRQLGSEQWAEGPLRGLPRYHERAASPADVIVSEGDGPYSLRPVDLKPQWTTNPHPLGENVDIRVTGFLPAAQLEERWEPGGDEFNPLMRFSVVLGSIAERGTLLASASHATHVPIGNQVLDVDFDWIEDPEELSRKIDPEPAALTVRVAGRRGEQRVPLADARGGPVAIRGTAYTIQVVDVYPHWTLSGRASPGDASMVLVRITGSGEPFLRAVVWPQVELSQDIDESGHRQQKLIDERIEIEATSVPRPGLTLVAGSVGLHAITTDPTGKVVSMPATLGQPVVFPADGMTVTIEAVSETARLSSKPRIIPPPQRDIRAGASSSLVQLEISEGEFSRRLWLEYSHYTYSSRAGYLPTRLRLTDGRLVELLYSRETVPLPAPVALETFTLETYPGGNRERDFISHVRFREDGGWGELREVRSNQPTAYKGWWFFQSTWDPPDPERNYAGMNYTGLGVGNRHGVLIQLLGGIMTVVGTFWAFYIKPVLLRRRLAAAAGSAPPDPARRAIDDASVPLRDESSIETPTHAVEANAGRQP
ncbi:MAG: hypothetical protein JSV80_10725 [Acidobacteriota bacterium]|nr:MAG: hypothetical protein JSV80_10725 [Acidobacteriota bacterium]